MWSTTVSSVSTLEVPDEEFLVNRAIVKPICCSKRLNNPVSNLDDYWFKRNISNPFFRLINENKTPRFHFKQVGDSKIKNHLKQTNVCETLQRQITNLKLLDVKSKVWHKPPCHSPKLNLSNYHNYPKLIVEIPGCKKIKAEKILDLVMGELEFD